MLFPLESSPFAASLIWSITTIYTNTDKKKAGRRWKIIVQGTFVLHTVAPGETLYGIALRYQSDPEQIVTANALYPPFTEEFRIFPGQLLVVPALSGGRTVTLYTVNQGETLTLTGRKFGTSAELIAGINDTIQNPDFIFASQQVIVPAAIYRIEEGDSIYGIARKMGVSPEAILKANRGRPSISADLIYSGTLLIVPLPISANIAVFQPLPGSEITEGSILSGFARAFEGTVLFEVRDSGGRVIGEERFTTAAAGGPAFAPFLTILKFDRTPAVQEGLIRVFTRSAVDNSVENEVIIPVYFSRN
ncbi:LysM peptidoglycan-binding domain-containing protein [Alteribacter natronophilus]|uniref:LysM peptidoglycan-binding domain-containing protein n=1 Tax=Alteribacter natronophilus TaxID=2583810 RepID=UPI00110D7E2A|nr:LysM peptidoglycan-binding domain-containing protein [Alteribacter natronophilus]TMW73465.1 LysM peptidoglycan-binding domain-containing protein [Alteribacter natronophilus]